MATFDESDIRDLSEIPALAEAFRSLGVTDPVELIQRRRANRETEFEIGQVPDGPVSSIDHVTLTSPHTFYPFQVRGVRWARARETRDLHGIRGGIWAIVMGLGKTMMAHALVLLTHEVGRPTLVLCEKTIMDVIIHEAEKFYSGQLRLHVIDPDGNRLGVPVEHAHEVVMTYDTFVQLCAAGGRVESGKRIAAKWSMIAQVLDTPFLRVICDESHRFGGSATQLSEGLKTLAPGYRLCMTGTPIRNHTDDIFAQLRICGLRGFETKGQCTSAAYGQLGLDAAILRISMEEAHVDLPPKTEYAVPCKLSGNERILYNHLTLYIQKLFNEGAKHQKVMPHMVQLRKLCVAPNLLVCEKKPTPLPPDFPPEVVSWISDRTKAGHESIKMRGLVHIMKQIPKGDHVLVFSFWNDAARLACEVLNREFPEETFVYIDGDTKNKTDKFGRLGAIRAICTCGVGTKGLNLTEANHVIFLEMHQNYTFQKQGAARVYRIGQQKPVNVFYLFCPGTIEEELKLLCDGKHDAEEVFKGSGVDYETVKRFVCR